MLIHDFAVRAMEGQITTEPFVNHHRQCILIARRHSFAAHLLRRHIAEEFGYLRSFQMIWLLFTLEQGGDGEIAE